MNNGLLFDKNDFQGRDKEPYPYYELLKQELILNPKEIEAGMRQHEREKIDILDNKAVFRWLMYCILTPGENYINLKKIWEMLLTETPYRPALDTPESIISNKSSLDTILQQTRYPKRKKKAVYELALNWSKLDLQSRILNDVAHGRTDEFEIRSEMDRDIYGVGYKCASMFLRMCEYEHVVPVDMWVLRFLNAQLDNKYSHLKEGDYPIKVSDFRTVSGLSRKEYLYGEKLMSIIAKDYGLSPARFQIVLWTHFASGKNLRIEEDMGDIQGVLF